MRDDSPAPGRDAAAGRPARRLTIEGIGGLIQAVAIVGAGAWAVYTFIYEARIKPGLAPPAVSVATVLVKAGERGDRVAIRSTVTRANVGQTGVRVLGLTYNVVGIRAQFDRGAGDGAIQESLAAATTIDAARDYALSEPGEVILRQGVLFAGATDEPASPSDLNPGETVSRDLIVYADRAKFDFVRFKVGLAYGKADEAPVALRFETGPGGEVALSPRVECRVDPDGCQRLKTTDFSTEFSLW